MSHRDPEPIETYLDELLLALRVSPRDARRLLSEVEAHLRASAAELAAGGLARSAAEREAVRRFGAVDELVDPYRRAHRPSAWHVAVAAVQMLLLLAAVGLVAIGVSAGVAATMNAVAGSRFVGDLPVVYSAHACSAFRAAQPTAVSCGQAAMFENAQDAVALRGVAGGVGLVLLAAALLWGRALRRRAITVRGLREGSLVAAAVAFGSAALFLLGDSADVALQHGSAGVGWSLSGGVVAAAAFLPCAVLAFRRLRPILHRGLVLNALVPA